MKSIFVYLGIITIASLLILANFHFLQLPYLTFSDAAKFADVGRNLTEGRGYSMNFSFFGTEIIRNNQSSFSAFGIPPLFPYLISLNNRLFGITDFSVLTITSIGYILGALLLYQLGKTVFNSVVGFLATLTYLFDPAIQNYAVTGASESLFIPELILSTLLIFKNTRKTIFAGVIVLVLAYFTRPTALIYALCLGILAIFLRSSKFITRLKLIAILIVSYIILEFILLKLSGTFFFYSSWQRFFKVATGFNPQAVATTYFRGGLSVLTFNPTMLFSKTFYNLYNFYKLLPQILSPYLAGFYLLSLFRSGNRKVSSFRFTVLIMTLSTLFMTALGLPIFRYLHPVTPFIYLIACEQLVYILMQTNLESFVLTRLRSGIAAFLLVFFFIIGTSIGRLILDSRFLLSQTNFNQPPTYVSLAKILAQHTKPEDLIITNLDSWASWYGHRKTVWFPLDPAQLLNSDSKPYAVDAIFLTSYKINDVNYALGPSWRQLYENPESINQTNLGKYYIFAGEYILNSAETYEKEPARAVLFIKKNNL